MPDVSLGDIAAHLGVAPPDAAQAVVISHLSLRSDDVAPGTLFLALPGATTHGARHAQDAIDRGAVALLTDSAGAALLREVQVPVLVVDHPRSQIGPLASWFHGDPSHALQVAGITGTNGKTTTTFLLEAALAAGGHRTGVIGTVETRIGAERIPSARTTPEAPDLQELLARMRAADVTAVAMEVSSHALALGRVLGTHFAVSGFTNLTQDHLDFHGSMEEYYLAKASLFTSIYSATAIVDVDDAYGRRLLAETQVPALTLSTQGRADWYLSGIHSTLQGSTAMVHAPDGSSGHLNLALPGQYNLANALMAIACAVNLGVSLEEALQGVGRCTGVPGRMERIDVGQDFLAVVDYAHTPDAVERILEQLRTLTTGRVITVLGCGGDRDAGKRPHMGRAAAEGSDLAIFTNDNPRSEEPVAIIDAMCAGVPDQLRTRVRVEPDRRAAIDLAIAAAAAGDVVLVAGKGHEQGQEVAGVVNPFDDREEMRRAIGSRRP